MNVLSLFDGMSCGQIALEKAGIDVDRYFASEIDKYAIQITKNNYPNTEHLGSVNFVSGDNLPKIDLIMGGSPCQGFSFAGKQLNFDDPRSKLFFEYVRILEECRKKNPDIKFLLENVKMKKESEEVISSLLGVCPVEINSALVSAQNRKRLYWTNIGELEQPEDRGIMLSDIVLADVFPVALHNLYGGFKEKKVRVFENKSPTITTASGGGHLPSFVYQFKHGCSKGGVRQLDKAPTLSKQWHNNYFKLIHTEKALEYMNRETKDGRNHWDFKHHSDINNEKSSAVVANFFKGVPYNVFKDWGCIRKFDPIECERLQTVKDNYTSGVSNTQRYKMIGNGWTVDVIAHILKGMM